MIQIELKKTYRTGSSFSLDFKTEIETGSIVSLYGPSGSGKTSILRMIAGLENADSGKILVDNESWFDSTLNLKPQERSVGYAFQDYALFDHLTVRQNIEFALKKGESSEIVDDLIKEFELSEVSNQKPVHLSGGQAQRTSLARAMAGRSKLLLLDEVLSAVEPELKDKIILYLKSYHHRFKPTILFVSHDLPACLLLSDHICMIKNGQVVKEGNANTVLSTAENKIEALIVKKDEVNGQFILHLLVNNKVTHKNVSKEEFEQLKEGMVYSIRIA